MNTRSNPDHPNHGDDMANTCEMCECIEYACTCEKSCGYWDTPQTRTTKCGACPTCEDWGDHEHQRRFEDDN